MEPEGSEWEDKLKVLKETRKQIVNHKFYIQLNYPLKIRRNEEIPKYLKQFVISRPALLQILKESFMLKKGH